MTLIATYINKYGIVMASDSNLTSRQGNSGFGQKVFPIPYLNAGITYSGLYEVGGKDIDDWMNDFIRNESFITNNIEEFVKKLTSVLNSDFKGLSTDTAIMHVCGYSKVDFESHCEHWHISNGNIEQGTGNYTPKERFEYQNDFNTRTAVADRVHLNKFDHHPNNNKFFLNGFPPARISLMTIRQLLDGVLVEISKNQKWSFRSQKNLFETANYLKMYFNLIGELFKMSDYEALFVGGETQTYLIPAPTDLRKE